MKLFAGFALLCGTFLAGTVYSAPAYVEPAKPAKSRIQGVAVQGAPSPRGEVQVPVITWGADAATLLANGGSQTTPDSLFGKAGLNLKLVKQDDFVVQVKDYLSGKSPFLRGTVGMVNTYAEALAADPRTAPVVVAQLSWSAGGDCLVVRGEIKAPRDLKGKTLLLQQYGPHVEYMDQILKDSGLGWSDVSVKWCEELYDTNGKPDDPATIMRQDPSIDAVFCISPDASALTSKFTVGTGAEGSVKGARLLLSSKSASRVIADVYAVRKDFYDANKDWVQKFVNAQLEGQNRVTELLAKSTTPEYKSLLKLGADRLLDNPEATADMEGLLSDCQLALRSGNEAFFGDPGNLVGFNPTVARNQDWLVAQGFLGNRLPVTSAGWSTILGSAAAAPKVKFKQEAAQKAAAETDESNVLFFFEINFQPNQTEFDEATYATQFQRALQLASTYAGAVLEIVGHSEPSKYLKMKFKDRASDEILAVQWQAGQNLSLQRANQVRTALLNFAKSKGNSMNESQFITNGKGYAEPKVKEPRSSDDVAMNRRVVFRVVKIEGESDVFEPIDYAAAARENARTPAPATPTPRR